MGEKFVDETDIRFVRHQLAKSNSSGAIAGNTSQKLTIGMNDFIPGSVSYKLVVSRSPALRLANQFAYLVEYPYGCTEQKVSAGISAIVLWRFWRICLTPAKQAKRLLMLISRKPFVKIKLRQLYNGGITLWDGEGTEHWWASVYAAHFLIEAQKAGYDVDNGLLLNTAQLSNSKLRSRETILYYYNQERAKENCTKRSCI